MPQINKSWGIKIKLCNAFCTISPPMQTGTKSFKKSVAFVVAPMADGHPLTKRSETLAMSVTIYHNPKCSKSHQTLELLGEQGITPDIVEYLKSPPTAEQLQEILAQLGFLPRDLIRKKEDIYADCKLDNPSLTNAELINYMVNHPILIERPIVIANGKAVIGRPPEQVLEILST
jgi:arsenate reductase (glutaredoxin)